jgi:hypothetical protein
MARTPFQSRSTPHQLDRKPSRRWPQVLRRATRQRPRRVRPAWRRPLRRRRWRRGSRLPKFRCKHRRLRHDVGERHANLGSPRWANGSGGYGRQLNEWLCGRGARGTGRSLGSGFARRRSLRPRRPAAQPRPAALEAPLRPRAPQIPRGPAGKLTAVQRPPTQATSMSLALA